MINMYDLAKKILAETDGQICKHCLGRKLSHIVDGRDNINRGEKIFEDLEIQEPEECVICGNIFDKINDDLFKKVYDKIYEYLTDFPKIKFTKNKGYAILEDFVKNKLKDYPKDKNNPDLRGTSNLSPYFNFGFLSPQRAAIEVLKSDAPYESKEVYLEELIVRAELSDNFCLYNKNYKSFDGAPDWAKKTLNYHIKDLRPHIFSQEQLENARSYDELWNATQKQLIEEGKIHGYLRMFWAKKLLEWTNTPYEAVDIAVYLNDKYAYDGESPNGYVGILWSIAGLHDRPFMNMPVTGEIRRLTGIKGKAEREKYIKRYL